MVATTQRRINKLFEQYGQSHARIRLLTSNNHREGDAGSLAREMVREMDHPKLGKYLSCVCPLPTRT